MTIFPDLDRFTEDTTEDDSLTLPISGREYVFRADLLPFGRALEIQKLREETARSMRARAAGDDFEPSPEFVEDMSTFDERRLYLDLIGETMRAQLIADEVPWSTVLHIGATLLSWHMYGKQIALRVWTRGKLEEGDSRPPAKASGTSKARTTSRSGSTKKTPRKPKPGSRGATTSNGGSSSKPTSTANTA